ncbi:MAG TPA: xanthine dehydrogenase family protein molybdopterin-binding subunit [Acidimicrobiia bacterium]|nr:xanthine dehydrogenase family protein molybdopterin-binding subunit [Acidimicrobiia bacterium]
MTVVGISAQRSDAVVKVRGEAIYGVDVALPGALHARLLRSPVAAGQIVGLDLSGARETTGVRAVISAEDAPAHRHGLVINDQPLFASERVLFEGEPIAAVAAETEAAARQAVAEIGLEIEEEAAVVDLESAVTAEARLVHPDWGSFVAVGEDFPRGGNVAGEVLAEPPGVDEAFAAADLVVEDVYRAGRQYQAYLEPKAVVAQYESGRYTVHVSHQYPFNVRDRLAQALGVRSSAIRVVGHHIGGGFGAKLDLGIEPYAALLARATGRPVKMVLDRAEDLLTCPCRENALVRLRSAVSRDGSIVAREIDVLMDAGAYAGDAPLLTSLPLLLAGAVYQVGPTRVRARAVYTNTTPTGAFRGVSGTYLVFALERHIDHIANALGRDRREYRLRILMEDGDRLLNGQELPDASILREAFGRIEEVAPWNALGDAPLRGVGVAAAVWLTNPMAGSAILKLHEDGTLGVVTGATDNGSGAVTMGITQIAAEELGLRPEDVVVSMPDTDVVPYDSGSQGSRTTQIVGRAVREAAVEVRNRLLSAASGLLEADAKDLELVGGKVGVKGVPESQIALAEVATAATFSEGPIVGFGSHVTSTPAHDPSCASGLLFPAFPTPTYHVHLAEVEVDPVTGNVTVLRYVVAQEVGKAINPDGVLGQIQGGVTQGLGYALYEGLHIGDDGKYRQRTLEAYRLPIAPDIPRVEAILLEHPNPEGPYGARGVAEPPVVPVAAAIANAVSDAIGAPIDAIPITPADVLSAIHAKRP